MLALFIDYVFLSALIFFTEKAIGSSDYLFFITFLITGFYFTFCNSELCTGQTLGKKVLGLKTLNSSGKALLDPTKSALRFFFSFGIIILLSEIPNLFYREQGVVASPFLLEFHMLLVMLLCSLSLCFSALTGSHRSIHDIICKTIVLRNFEITSIDEELNLQFESSKKNKIWLSAFAFFAAFFLWSLGVVQPKAVSNVNMRKYKIEKELDTRLLSVSFQQQTLEWISLIPNSNQSSNLEIAKKYGHYLIEQNIVKANEVEDIHFIFHKERDVEKPDVVVFETATEIAKKLKIEG